MEIPPSRRVSQDRGSPFPTLRRFIRLGRENQSAMLGRCDFCAAPIPDEHRHLLEVAAREVRCTCRPCALLFDREAASEGRFRLIPERRLRLAEFHLPEEAWKRLGIPVGLAYLVPDAPSGRVLAWYPGPAGAIEAEVDPACWNDVRDRNPLAGTLETDVEALLVYRVRDARQYYILPIDDCFSLVGLIRRRWRGMSGGTEVWEEVARYFEALERRSRVAAR